MGVLEQITQMKKQGLSDEDIVNNLQEQGISPREINDALNQSQIKNAVNNEGEDYEMAPQGANPPIPTQGNYVPKTQEVSEQEAYAPQSQQEYSQPEQYYQDSNNYPATEGSSSDLIIEISEQVFSEKIKKIQKQTDDMNEFKTLAQTKIENMEDRLKRIETSIDKLQMAILEKIGSYGENINSIKKEMSMMQDSFGKVVNQAVKGHHAHLTSKKVSKKKSSKK